MKIEIEEVTNWRRVVNAARLTQGKKPIEQEPSDHFKRRMIFAEHSPLRLLEFDIRMYDIPYYVMGHLVRHVHAQPFVSTSRPDITGSGISRHDMPQDAPVTLQLSLNAQEIINISKVRLCGKADVNTRTVWEEVVKQLAKIEPILAKACVPSCIYRAGCPERPSCGKRHLQTMLQYIQEFKKMD